MAPLGIAQRQLTQLEPTDMSMFVFLIAPIHLNVIPVLARFSCGKGARRPAYIVAAPLSPGMTVDSN